MKRKVLSILLSAGLVLSMVTATAPAVFSMEKLDPASYNLTATTIIRGMHSSGADYSDYVDNYVYNEALFGTDARIYNAEMADMSYGLSLVSLSTRYKGDCTYNLQTYLEDNGFEDFYATDSYRNNISVGEVAVAFAHKTIYVDEKPYTLLAIIPRGGTTSGGWDAFLKISSSESDNGDYAGFSETRDELLVRAKQYVTDNHISGDIKLWGAGYSGGGGVLNLVAASIADDVQAALGDTVTAGSEDMYFYTYVAPNVAGPSADKDNQKYDCIQNLYSDVDLISNVPANKSGFGKYGQKHIFTNPEVKETMLKHLKNFNSSEYEIFIKSSDTDLYTPYKVDKNSIESGNFAFVPDNDSYLPDDLAGFINVITENITDICARESDSGTDHRAGYYKTYQAPAIRLITYIYYLFGTGGNYTDVIMGENAVPMLLSMYLTYAAEKTGSVNEALNHGFNLFAAFMEDENGNIKDPSNKELNSVYNTLKSRFKESGSDDPNQKYVLVNGFRNNEAAMRLLRKLTAILYGQNIRTMMESSGRFSEEAIKQIAEDDSEVMSYFIANILFGNSLQSDTLETQIDKNEQLKMAATTAASIEKMMTNHMWPALISWVRAGNSSNYDYMPPTEAQSAGYRRVYLDNPSGASVTGTVKDINGDTVAMFVDGVMLEKTSKWIGLTTCEKGSWLRLPADKTYFVMFSSDKECKYSTSIAEYSVAEGSVEGDLNQWSDISLTEGNVFMLSVPAITKTDRKYVIPSNTGYTAVKDITEAEADGIIQEALRKAQEEARKKAEEEAKKKAEEEAKKKAEEEAKKKAEEEAKEKSQNETKKVTITVIKNSGKIKSLKAKAGKKTVKLSWKKLSKAKRKKFSKIEIQYSTSKKFRTNVKTKYVRSKKKSVKIKKLKSGKKYYVRVRAYIKKGNNVYVSKWSSVKKVKVK